MAAEGLGASIELQAIRLDFELLEDFGHAARINVGVHQVLPADVIGLEFVFLGETLGDEQLRTPCQHAHQSGVAPHE